MYKRSVRRAYFGISPHLWPFAAWRMLVTWTAVAIVGVFGAAYVAGADFTPLGVVLVTPLYVIWIAFYLLVPAAIIAIFDLVLVRRPMHRPAKFNAKPRRTDLQTLSAWAGYAATASTAFGVAYLFIFLNAFAPDSSFLVLLETHLIRFAFGGAGAGLVVAWTLNVLHNSAPAQTLNDQLRRGAFVWVATVGGFAAGMLVLSDATLETTMLPGGLLAVIGAAVIPQLAVTPPTDLSQIPPPQLPDSIDGPTAPSPSPRVPEGGAGEGARGDWRTAPPPKISPTPIRDGLEHRGGGARGESSAPPPRTNRSDRGGEVGLDEASSDERSGLADIRTYRVAIQKDAGGRQAASNELDRMLIRSKASTRSNTDSISAPTEVAHG